MNTTFSHLLPSYIVSVFLLTSSFCATAYGRDLVLGTNVSSAYAADYSARIQGGSIEHVECIFERLQYPHSIVPMPWRRVHQEVRKHEIDGFFTAVLLSDVNKSHGALSDPLVLENWYWFWRADMPEPESWHNHKLGAILGSSQAMWLDEEKYAEPMSANNLPQLLKLLFSKRIDAVLADKEHFEKAAAELGVSSDSFHYRFYRYVPLGVYFGKEFLTAEPHFLQRFNHNIYPCAPEGFQVSEYEREKLKQLVLPWVHEWMARSDVISPVVSQNKEYQSTALPELMLQDDAWATEFQHNKPDFSAGVLQNPLSQILREVKEKMSGMVTEIIVTDARGFNVGISDMTSDFWQGDEPKFVRVINRPVDTLFFDAVGYDESTRRFQVQLSLQLYQPENPQAIGVVTVGVDIEKALSLPK